jgi:ubiquinol-cytochrome c reductase cytochrome b subunit
MLWFFFDLLPFYAILRSIPNKLLGVIAMLSALLALLLMPYVDLSRTRGIQFKPGTKLSFFIFVANFILLMILGAKHVEAPFIALGMVSTFIYFFWFVGIIPSFSFMENTILNVRPYINKNWGPKGLASITPPKPHSFTGLPLQSIVLKAK